jgi:hypothetical protein
MSEFQLRSPVAFIIFNRPDTTERVFAEIAKAKPPKLLVVGDGPRANRVGEADKVALTRGIIDRVDWDCEVLTNFSEINLGCKRRVSSGIDWVFGQVEEAIILEDDCLPEPTFFRYCQELLEHYRNDQRIGMITGGNFQLGNRRNNDSYYFSKYFHIWGWASWRDRWANCYDVTMAKWPRVRDENWLTDIIGSTREASFWKKKFELVYRGEIDTWDYQWDFANWVEGRISIIPNVNMISNIGFNRDATHTTGDSEFANLPRNPMLFPLIHPVGIIKNLQADHFTESRVLHAPLLRRIWNKIAGWLR